MNTYDINIDLSQLEAKCLDPDTQEFDLNKYEGDRKELILDFGTLIKNDQIMAKALKDEENKIKEKRDKLSARVEKNLNSLSNFVNVDEKFQDTRIKIKYSKSERLIIDNESKLPINFQKITLTAKKAEIKEFLKSGDINDPNWDQSAAHLEKIFNLKVT